MTGVRYSMEWEEFDAPGVGPRMLFPMAWSLLPLTVGLILLVRSDGLWPTAFLSAGIMLSLVAVWLGASKVPGRVDMIKLLVSPFAALSLYFLPPEIIQAFIAVIIWVLDYKTAVFLSEISLKAYRLEWEEDRRIPDVKGATFFRRKWAPKPLFRVGQNLVRGVIHDEKIMLEADFPIDFLSE